MRGSFSHHACFVYSEFCQLRCRKDKTYEIVNILKFDALLVVINVLRRIQMTCRSSEAKS